MTAMAERTQSIDGSAWIGGVPELIFTAPMQAVVKGRSGEDLAAFVTQNCIDIADAADAARGYERPHFNATMHEGSPGIMQFSVRTKEHSGERHPDLYAGLLLARSLEYFGQYHGIRGVQARWLHDSDNYQQYCDALEDGYQLGDRSVLRRDAARQTWTAKKLFRLGFRTLSGDVIETKTYEGQPMVVALFTK